MNARVADQQLLSWETLGAAAAQGECERVGAIAIAYARADRLLRTRLGARAFQGGRKLLPFDGRVKLAIEQGILTDFTADRVDEVTRGRLLRHRALHASRNGSRVSLPVRLQESETLLAVQTFHSLVSLLDPSTAPLHLSLPVASERSIISKTFTVDDLDDLLRCAGGAADLARSGAVLVAVGIVQGAVLGRLPPETELGDSATRDAFDIAFELKIIPEYFRESIDATLQVRNQCAHDGHLIRSEHAVGIVSTLVQIADQVEPKSARGADEEDARGRMGRRDRSDVARTRISRRERRSKREPATNFPPPLPPFVGQPQPGVAGWSPPAYAPPPYPYFAPPLQTWVGNGGVNPTAHGSTTAPWRPSTKVSSALVVVMACVALVIGVPAGRYFHLHNNSPSSPVDVSFLICLDIQSRCFVRIQHSPGDAHYSGTIRCNDRAIEPVADVGYVPESGEFTMRRPMGHDAVIEGTVVDGAVRSGTYREYEVSTPIVCGRW